MQSSYKIALERTPQRVKKMKDNYKLSEDDIYFLSVELRIKNLTSRNGNMDLLNKTQ